MPPKHTTTKPNPRNHATIALPHPPSRRNEMVPKMSRHPPSIMGKREKERERAFPKEPTPFQMKRVKIGRRHEKPQTSSCQLLVMLPKETGEEQRRKRNTPPELSTDRAARIVETPPLPCLTSTQLPTQISSSQLKPPSFPLPHPPPTPPPTFTSLLPNE